MSNNDLLKELVKAGEEVSDKPVSTTIAQVKFEIGFSAFCAGYSMVSLFQPMNDPKDAREIKAALMAKIEGLGGRPNAVIGLKYTSPAEKIISFEAEFGKERFIQRYNEENDFDKIIGAINRLSVPIGEWVWCKYETIESLTAIAKGENGKFTDQNGKLVFPRIIVPVEKFADEAAARAVVGSTGKKPEYNWSDAAKKELGDDISDFHRNAEEVRRLYHQILDQKAPVGGFKLPEPLTAVTVKAQIADIYSVESSDIEILLDIAPF